MARITVEDCLEKIDNRFDLVRVAARRARGLKMGNQELLPWDNDKPTVLALREIADGRVDRGILDQPLMPPAEEELDVTELHRETAEKEAEDVSSHDEDDDLDDETETLETKAEAEEEAALEAGPSVMPEETVPGPDAAQAKAGSSPDA